MDSQAEEERKQAMMQDWSTRDRDVITDAKSANKDKLDQIKKDLNRNMMSGGVEAPGIEQLAYAIYDGADVKSRHNQIVRQIEQDKSLSEAEKESLLKNHNQSLAGIDDMMEIERKK